MLASRPRPQRTGNYLKLKNDFVFDHCAVAGSKSRCLRELVLADNARGGSLTGDGHPRPSGRKSAKAVWLLI